MSRNRASRSGKLLWHSKRQPKNEFRRNPLEQRPTGCQNGTFRAAVPFLFGENTIREATSLPPVRAAASFRPAPLFCIRKVAHRPQGASRTCSLTVEIHSTAHRRCSDVTLQSTQTLSRQTEVGTLRESLITQSPSLWLSCVPIMRASHQQPTRAIARIPSDTSQDGSHSDRCSVPVSSGVLRLQCRTQRRC